MSIAAKLIIPMILRDVIDNTDGSPTCWTKGTNLEKKRVFFVVLFGSILGSKIDIHSLFQLCMSYIEGH